MNDTKWCVGYDKDECSIFTTYDEAVTYFDNTIGQNAYGKEHWCDLCDEHVWEID